jgi:hypothetical protein
VPNLREFFQTIGTTRFNEKLSLKPFTHSEEFERSDKNLFYISDEMNIVVYSQEYAVLIVPHEYDFTRLKNESFK